MQDTSSRSRQVWGHVEAAELLSPLLIQEAKDALHVAWKWALGHRTLDDCRAACNTLMKALPDDGRGPQNLANRAALLAARCPFDRHGLDAMTILGGDAIAAKLREATDDVDVVMAGRAAFETRVQGIIDSIDSYTN